MLTPDTGWPNFSDADLDFVVSVVAPGAASSNGLKRLIVGDPQFRSAMIGDDRLFDRVLNDEEVLLHISPALYFEVLLRRSYQGDRDRRLHRRAGGQGVDSCVRHSRRVEVHEAARMVEYLASMMASFTRIQSYVVPVRVRRGYSQAGQIQRHGRGQPCERFAAAASHEQRFGYYKRIADVCLFLSGVFPDSAPSQPSGGESARTVRAWRMRRSIEEFERDGRRFYGLAARTPGSAGARAVLSVRDPQGQLHVRAKTADSCLDALFARTQA